MATEPPPKGHIKRVPVPVRYPAPPAPISTTTTSPPVAAQITLSSSPGSTQPPFVVHGQYRPRGPIPLVDTNSYQPLPAHFTYSPEHNHYSQHAYPYTLHAIRMDPESQNHHSTLPAHVEEDIKAAVLASLPPNDHSVPMKKRKTVVHRKNIRWTSLSLCMILIIGEIPVSAIYSVDIPALTVFIFGPFLALWNGWRLFRLRQKFDNEIISGWHVGFEVVALSATIAATAVIISWTVGQVHGEDLYDVDSDDYMYFWRGVSVSILVFVCFILHFTLLIITVVEKWTKPAYLHMALAGNSHPQQPPQIIVQYTPRCPVCHGHEPQPGENENTYLANIGDSQPQGVAPATLGQQKEAMYTDESLNEHEYYVTGNRPRI
ncbi:hypothetical protein F5Y12DRAFT_714959 [Xylaria sp. FL1777]|nr:hypothetical protein F5Y12DRAFT_714959 [Xylaria sp. FL1777]